MNRKCFSLQDCYDLLYMQSLTMATLTVTFGYSDTFSDSQIIANRFQVVTVTTMRLQ